MVFVLRLRCSRGIVIPTFNPDLLLQESDQTNATAIFGSVHS